MDTEAIEKQLKDAGDFSDALLDPDTSEEVMLIVMDYYVKIHKVVKQKVQHARKATRKRINDLESTSDKPLDKKMADRFEELDDLWSKLSGLLNDSGLSADELDDVNDTFEDIPKTIKLYYDQLVEMDKELVTLINEITATEYKLTYEKAKKITRTIQKGKNLLSNLPESEFDPPAEKVTKRQAPDEYDFVQEPTVTTKKPEKKKSDAGKDVGTVRTPDGRRMRVIS